MGKESGQTAILWRKEFQKESIGFDEMVIIGNNLGKLKSPEFIPNVFQLIDLAKKEINDEHRINAQMYKKNIPQLPSREEVLASSKTSEDNFNKLRSMF